MSNITYTCNSTPFLGESQKYHYFYKITNKINNRFYYGIKSTKNLNDGYCGSGEALIHAEEKYGIENFHKEILEFFKTRKECSEKEREIVTKELIENPLCYNMRTGGDNYTSPSEETKLKISETLKKKFKQGKLNINKINTKEAIEKRKISMELFRKNNPSTICFNKKTKECKKILNSELQSLSEDWLIGKRKEEKIKIKKISSGNKQKWKITKNGISLGIFYDLKNWCKENNLKYHYFHLHKQNNKTAREIKIKSFITKSKISISKNNTVVLDNVDSNKNRKKFSKDNNISEGWLSFLIKRGYMEKIQYDYYTISKI